MGIVRAEVIAKMRGAFRKGQSASAFMKGMKQVGLSYRRSDMLADWRTVNELEVKAGLARFVRKDRFPAATAMASVTWAMSKEYMYKVKVLSVIRIGEPVTERFVNILSDKPLTPEMVQAQVEEQWLAWERYQKEEIVGLQVWTAVRRVAE